VDEALSVGDVFFQQKCFQRIHTMLDAGTTLLFVSHDTAAVQNLCNRAIVLQEGRSIYEGPPEEAASRYYASSPGRAIASLGKNASASSTSIGRANEALKAEILANNILPSARSRHGAKDAEITGAAFVNEHGLHSLSVEMLKTAQIHVLLKADNRHRHF
jgi:lipopolysaccharide transport system ATP-binding protein